MPSIQPSTEFIETVREMLAEQGETWAQTSYSYSGEPVNRSFEQNAVVIAFSPESCYRLMLTPGSDPDWIIKEDVLRPDEIGQFFVAFGAHWQLLIGSLITTGTGQMRVRAFIKNGRKVTQEWSVSLGEVKTER